MIGKVYNIPPQPAVAENTRYLPAGSLTFGVEYRDVDPEGLVETYKGNAAYLAELVEKSPEGGFSDEGVSIHVWGTADGHEYLRFDVFETEPHYHYVHRSEEVVNNVIDFDVAANGDMLPWVLERLRTRLAEMLTQAGGAHLLAELDREALARATDEVAALAEHAREKQRALREAHGR
jgi:hypothetical protein